MSGPLVSRRRFLGGLAAVGAAAYGIDRWATGGGPAPRLKKPARAHQVGPTATYRSAPRLVPPRLDVLHPAEMATTGLLFLTPAGGPGQYGPMIADDTGQPVWFHPLSGPWPGSATKRNTGAEVSTNFRVSRYKGRPVLSWWQGQIGQGPQGSSRYVIADRHYRQIVSFGAGNGLRGDSHEFVVASDDTALITFYEPTPADLSSVGGPTQGSLLDCGFQRLDIATGAVLFQWKASDFITLSESYRPLAGQGTTSSPWDFFHINSIDVDTDGDYIISARHTWAVYKIDHTTGAVVWRLNGKRSDFRVAPRARFSWQHDARHHGASLLSVFDDGAGAYKTASHSRGLVLLLNFDAMTATLAEQYTLRGVLSYSQGSTQLLPDGNVVVGWGSEPYVSEYTKGGRLLFSARLPRRSDSYRAYRFPWTGKPLSPPAVAVQHKAGPPQVYASWNGATAVSAWQVLSGPRAHGGLRPTDRSRRLGFETVIPATNATATDRYFAVAALDARGRVLGRSPAVRAQ